ncbi:MAG: nucleotidyltransferase domain-containing protein [Phycisphaerae bacterium]|nr:nucleotidyltransferase domain-containing protein [Phycisphaerae bacterium]
MRFDVDKLTTAVRQACPEAVFAFLHGSARDGDIREGGDIDIALYLEGPTTLEILGRVIRAVEELAPGVRCDCGVLNRADCVYRFEALKGRMLFCRDEEKYAGFFSLTCREYEYQMADYERQHRYRLEYHCGEQTASERNLS